MNLNDIKHKLGNLPLFRIIIGEEEEITTISLVENPAMELPLFTFSKSDSVLYFTDEEEHNIISCIVRTDYPIYRRSLSGDEYYVIFDKEASEALSRKLIKNGFSNCISKDHNGELISGIELVNVFIKDTDRGIDPKGFDSAAEGSLFGIWHITDENLWSEIKEGRFGGVSLEAVLDLEEVKFSKNIKNKLNMSKLKEQIKRLLLSFNEVETDKGILTWEEDNELQVGYAVFIDGEVAPDGEYRVDNKVFVVKDGLVAEIKDVPVEEIPDNKVDTELEDVSEEKPESDIEAKEELEAKIADLEARLAEVEKKLAAIETKEVEEPIEDQFSKTPKADVRNRKIQNAVNIAKWLK